MAGSWVSLIGIIRRPTQNRGLDSSLPVGPRLLAQMGLVAKVIKDAWTASIQTTWSPVFHGVARRWWVDGQSNSRKRCKHQRCMGLTAENLTNCKTLQPDDVELEETRAKYAVSHRPDESVRPRDAIPSQRPIDQWRAFEPRLDRVLKDSMVCAGSPR